MSNKKQKTKGLTQKEKDVLLSKKDKHYELKKQMIHWIIKKQQILTVGELSRRLDRSKETVIVLLNELEKDGYDIQMDSLSKEVKETKSSKYKKQMVKPKYRHCIKIAHISDTHLGSTFQQLSLLHDAYGIMEKEEVDFCLHYGDLSDGPREMHKRPEEVFLQDTDSFLDYIVKNYPKTNKFHTYVLDSGTHDTFFKRFNGINIVRRVCEQRNDLILRRGDEAEFTLSGTEDVMVKMVHPMGGSAYSRSYKQQKYLENLIGSFLEKLRVFGYDNDVPNPQPPHIFGMGHYHVYNHLEQGGVECFLIPCFQAQTRYLRDKGLYPNVGFLITTLHFDQNKHISRVAYEAYRFNAYIKKNDY